MLKIHFYSLLILSLFSSILASQCQDNSNLCSKCDLAYTLCSECVNNLLIPDANGGCTGKQKCSAGENYCEECDDSGKICNKCEDSLQPDENGGCSFTKNCEISIKGECLKCKNDFILIGEEYSSFKFCKSLLSDDFKNCEKINSLTGLCETCKENYFQNLGDKKCVKIENCQQSIYGNCVECKAGYYLNKKNEKCVEETSLFQHCKVSLDGTSCDECRDDYYLLDQKCIPTNFCSKATDDLKCKECIEGYYLTEKFTCSTTENCYSSDNLSGFCKYCSFNYLFDYDIKTCISNREENDFKNCKTVYDNKCTYCESGYFLTDDNKCTLSKNCSKASNGICISCNSDYYLGLDNKCSIYEHCIYSGFWDNCEECEDGYYFSRQENKCQEHSGNYMNCKISDYNEEICAFCKKNFYVSKIDNLCHSNQNSSDVMYKCAVSDYSGDYCSQCEDGYFIGAEDKKCSKISFCKKSVNENECEECEENYCLDLKNNKCVWNGWLEEGDSKFYFRCLKTDKNGLKCEKCDKNLILNEEGLCVDVRNCETKNENDECIKCYEGYCLNKNYGCVKTLVNNCVKCDDELDFDFCTECENEYEFDENEAECVKISDSII